MKGLSFIIKGSIAHFRRPDTTATQLTYPFITPTAVKGLVGAILGISDFVTRDKIGIELLHPVRAVAQQMSMLGKDGGGVFNRPTTIELLVNPSYRVFYTGDEYTEDLIQFLYQEKAVYTTYLGAAYALTKPMLDQVYDNVQYLSAVEGRILESKTVVPTIVIQELILKPDHYYCRAGGYLYEYKGNRTFEKSVDFIYEKDGKPISFKPKEDDLLDVRLAAFGGNVICLV